jgi:3-hydroxybutyryl-CoA dehydratase
MDLKDIPAIMITQAMIDEYARLSGDFNPLHVDPVMAAATPFGGTIAHGCIPMEPIFQAIRKLTGAPALPSGSIMSLRYLRPSQPGDTIRIEALPQAVDAEGKEGGVAFACINQRGDKVIEGRWTLPQ